MPLPIPLTDERRSRPGTYVHPELTFRALAFPESAREWLGAQQALARTLPDPAIGAHASPAAAGHSDVEIPEVGAGEFKTACRPAGPEVPR